MRTIWWILVFLAVSACGLGITLYPHLNFADNPVASRIAVGYFLLLSLGSYWMLYDCIRHDRKFTRKVWLFFIPGGFLWYYFERFRPRQVRNRQELHS
jgi:hypothetical protein